MTLSRKTRQLLAVVLPIIIIVAIISIVKSAKPPEGRSFSNTVYVLDESDDKAYFFRYNTLLNWPATYQDRTLWPLYRCSDCGSVFVVRVGRESKLCPSCGSRWILNYTPEEGESMDAEEIHFKDIEFPPGTQVQPDD